MTATEVPHIPAAPAQAANGRPPAEDCAPCAEAKAARARPEGAKPLSKGERIMGALAVAGGVVLILMGIDVASGFALSRGLGLLPAEDSDGNRSA
jgi:hypothetical protein